MLQCSSINIFKYIYIVNCCKWKNYLLSGNNENFIETPAKAACISMPFVKRWSIGSTDVVGKVLRVKLPRDDDVEQKPLVMFC